MAPAVILCVKFMAGVFTWVDFQGEEGWGVSRRQQSIEGRLQEIDCQLRGIIRILQRL